MVTRKRLRSILTALGLYVMAALLIGYFGVNAYSGNHGLKAKEDLDQQIATLSADLDRLKLKPAEEGTRELRPAIDWGMVGSQAAEFSKEREFQARSEMLLIRRFEEKAGQMYGMGLIGGFCHLYIGQEAVVVGMEMAKHDGDQMITGYRDHGHMLACGMDPKGVMAELTGRRGGYSKGKGGSMHMFSRDKNFYGGARIGRPPGAPRPGRALPHKNPGRHHGLAGALRGSAASPRPGSPDLDIARAGRRP